MRRRMSLGLLLLWALASASCGKSTISWTEEVQLGNKKIILVERALKGQGNAEIGGPSYWRHMEMSISFKKDDNTVPLPPEWHAKYVPVLLDHKQESNAWVLVATPDTCETWYELGRPIPPYIQYESVNGAPWRQVGLEDALIGRKTNLLTGPSTKGEPVLLTLPAKEDPWRRAGPKYQTILRKWGVEEYNNCL